MTDTAPLSADRQYIYRCRHETLFGDALPDGVRFVHFLSPLDAACEQAALLPRMGATGLIKLMAKLIAPSRQWYGAVREGMLVHEGWVTLGRCRWYPLPADGCVIGPIWTSPSSRGSGLATLCLKRVMDELHARGVYDVFIDTAGDNRAAQRVFEKCGFGEAIDSFERPHGGLQ